MSGDQLNLDAIEARNEIAWEVSADEWVENRDKCDAFSATANDVPALVAEVRRLRAIVGRVDALRLDWRESKPRDQVSTFEAYAEAAEEILDAMTGE